MKKSFKLKNFLRCSVIIILLIAVNISSLISSANDEKILEANIPRQKVINQLKSNNQKLNVEVIGDVNTSEIEEFINKKQLNGIARVASISDVDSIWVSEENTKDLLNDTIKMKDILSEGISIYFINLQDMNILRHTFCSNRIKEESLDILPDFQFITQGSKGNYFIGYGHFHDLLESEKQESLLASAWNRKNDIRYSGAMKQDKVQSTLNKKLASLFASEAYAGSNDYTINSKWTTYSSGWETFEHYSTYGDVNEWRAFYSYDDGADNYYAIADSMYMSPSTSSTSACVKLDVEVDCDSYQSGNEIFKYSPQIAPTSDTYTFSIGAGTNGEATIGASWSIIRKDLTTSFSGTSQSDEIYKASFSYDVLSEYAQTENRQDFSVILQGESSTICEFSREYRGYFRGNYAWDTSDCGSSYHITLE
ncbi:hypothetical protein HZI73_04675 [Vallitalea pronyensis]|uniref:Uncharacterized protein n=1 Tax=Vallitalea pronyensis TaxID=1348613 RepID=A0A8J8MHC0_9FIRM|nr:hypothetical protein [Vallitalea pronyensis]QUI21630.1 hypothetical protein HZI73_04675 [Vallitalea pronyensis]